MKYLVALTAAATILLTPGCLEEKVNHPPSPPRLNVDAKGMGINNPKEPADTQKPVQEQPGSDQPLYHVYTPGMYGL